MATAKSPTSAARRKCLGKWTAAAGTPTTASSHRQSLPLGRPHPRRSDRPHRAAVGPLQRDGLERPQRRRNFRGEEVGRLVFPRDHRRGVAVEDEVPHRPRRLPTRRTDPAAGPQAAERHARTAALWDAAADAGAEHARAVEEIELRVHGYEEIDRPEFWKFIDEAMAGFAHFPQGASITRTPPAVEGIGAEVAFRPPRISPRQAVEWDGEVLEELIELLAEMAPHGQFLWNNKQVVPLYVPEQKEPWAAVQTKKKVDARPRDAFRAERWRHARPAGWLRRRAASGTANGRATTCCG